MDPGGLIQVISVGATALAAVVVVIGVTVRVVLVGPQLKAKRLAAASAAASEADAARLSARMDGLEEEVRHLGEALERVAAAAEFDAQLRAGGAPPGLPPSPGQPS